MREFVPVYAVRLACVDGKWSIATQNILARRDWLKVPWIYAPAIAAQMVKF